MNSKERFTAARTHASVGKRIETVNGGVIRPAQRGSLTRKLGGLWYARMDATGEDLCVGGGYDWMLI